MSEHIIVESAEGLLRISMSRPQKKNALTFAMYGALADALEAGDDDDAVRVMTLTGAGGCFTAGNDVGDFMNASAGIAHVLRFLNAISGVSKPVVAVVPGVAIGIGVTMLLHCDLVYAAEDATFKTPFVDLGLVPEAASSLLLPLMLGQRRAAELLLLGDTLSADQAREYGIVNAVFPPNDLSTRAMERVARLASRAPAAVRATKALMKRAWVTAVKEAMAAEGAVFGERLSSPELAEAVMAFMERRTPDFSKFY